MAAIVANTGSNNWNTNGAWVGAVQPTAADDVTIPATAVVTIPTATTVQCRSCTVSASGQLAFASTTAVVNIGDGTAGVGSVAFSNAGTITLTGIGTINLISTSSTQQTITTGGQTLPNYTVNGTNSSYLLSDANTSSGTVTVTTGIFNTGGQTCSWGSFFSNGNVARTLTLGASAITIPNGSWSINSQTGLTMTANTATITMAGAGAVFAMVGSINGSSIIMTCSGAALVGTAGSTPPTVGAFTRTGTAVKSDGTTLRANGITVSGACTLTGNSAINRMFVQSNTIGTTATITAATVSLTNVDFQDITAAGAASPFTGTSLGDCLGNTNITFTTPTTQTYDGTTSNWSTSARWTSRVPLPQDSVLVNTGSGTLTVDMPRTGKDINFTGFTGTASYSSASNTSFGSLTFSSGMTISGTQTGTLSGRSSHTITTTGNNPSFPLIISGPGGTYTLQDAYTCVATNSRVTVSDGTLDTGNFNMTISDFLSNSGRTRALTAGTSTISLYNTGVVTIWNIASVSGLTMSAASSTIIVSAASTNTRTFGGSGQTYGTLTYTVATSPGLLTITGANTFTNLSIGSGRQVIMPASTTNTITNFNVNGTNNGYIYMPGVAANYLTTPDSAALSVTGDIDVRMRLSMDDWTPATLMVLFNKLQTSGQYGYDFLVVQTSGQFQFRYSHDGTTIITSSSTVAPTVADGATLWVRATRNSTTGDVKFYTSTTNTNDPTAAVFTQLGSTVANSTGTIFDGTDAFIMGGQTGGFAFPGKMYRLGIYGTIGGSTPVFDADFTAKAFGANSFVESSSNAATVTINGTLAQSGDGRVTLSSSTPGTTSTLTSSRQQSVDYLTIQDSTVDSSPRWYAGMNSVLISNDANWLQTAPGIAISSFVKAPTMMVMR